jgi:hypothetical protein
MGIQFSQMPVVFLSFDEPYADDHYKRLKDRIPHAKRVHGVKGFDAAHKAAAEEAQADEFITVDADNIVVEDFWHIYLDSRPHHLASNVLSWRSFNVCNGLQYGNGGLKLWHSDFIQNMVTHEKAKENGETLVDFCWDNRYTQLRPVFSVTDFTSSAHHAWRAGFREGAKMPLAEGKAPPSPSEILEFSYKSCIDRLVQWCCVGRDQGFGGWAMAGTIEGLLRVHILKTTDLSAISEYESLRAIWDSLDYVNEYALPADPFASAETRPALDRAMKLIQEVSGIYLPVLGPVQSKTVKRWMWPTKLNNAYEEDSWHSIHW